MWIYLSPHLDDAIFSCGAIIASQVESGQEVAIWTIFAGTPAASEFSPFTQHLHGRYGYGMDPMGGRRREDENACNLMGVSCRHFPLLEAIYRQGYSVSPLYPTHASLLGEPAPEDTHLLNDIKQLLQNLDPGQQLIAPLGIGKHVDHLFTHAAAMQSPEVYGYYEDFPYAARGRLSMQRLVPEGFIAEEFSVVERHVRKWTRAISAYVSQVQIFWPSKIDMERTVWSYYASGGGKSVWRRGSEEQAPFSAS